MTLLDKKGVPYIFALIPKLPIINGDVDTTVISTLHIYPSQITRINDRFPAVGYALYHVPDVDYIPEFLAMEL